MRYDYITEGGKTVTQNTRDRIEYDRRRNEWALFYGDREPEFYPTEDRAQSRWNWLRRYYERSAGTMQSSRSVIRPTLNAIDNNQ